MISKMSYLLINQKQAYERCKHQRSVYSHGGLHALLFKLLFECESPKRHPGILSFQKGPLTVNSLFKKGICLM